METRKSADIDIVVDEMQTTTRDRNNKKNVCTRLFTRGTFFPSWMVVILFIAIGLSYLGSYLTIVSFPSPKRGGDSFSREFLAENAYQHTYHFSQNIGPRVTGTVNNEVKAVEYIWSVINEIVRTKSDDVDIEIAHDINDGIFYRSPKFYKMINAYRGLQNIVVKLSPKGVNASLNHILLNAHFDTVPLSPGAGDDVQMIAIMLELLRVFSRERILDHPVLFLFNGCEENGLAATHAFIHNNKWADKVGVLLNLESSGGGGKEILFQVREEHPWLTASYASSVKHPFTNILSEELYAFGLIQSDTDYTNFENYYNKLPAMSFAQARDGYTYHTKFDDIWTIPLGSLQNTGENMFDLVKGLDKKWELDHYLDAANDDDAIVYYDFLGGFMVFYSALSSSIVNYVFSCFIIGISIFRTYQIKRYHDISTQKAVIESAVAHAVQIVTTVLAALVVIAIAAFMDACNRSLFWYANPWLIGGVYFCPFVLISCLGPVLYLKFRKLKNLSNPIAEFHVIAQANIIAVIGIIMTAIGIRSTYILQLVLGFYIIVILIITIFRGKETYWIFLYSLGNIVPSMYVLYLLNFFLMVMIPGIARRYNGSVSNPEYSIAMFVIVFAFLGTSFYTPVIIMFKRRHWILALFAAVFVVFLIMAFTPIGFPFRHRAAPQRYTIWHVKRLFFGYDGETRKNDAGYYVYGYDRRGVNTVKSDIERFNEGYVPHDDCEQFIGCGQPWFRPQYRNNAGYNYWIPAEDPLIPFPFPMLKYNGAEQLSARRTNYSFSLAGTNFMMVHISPLPGVKISEWSLHDIVPDTGRWNGRDLHTINYVHGVLEWEFKDLDWWMVVETPEGWDQPYAYDIGHAALFVDHEETKTPQFKEFCNSFPEWTNVQNWTATFVAYQY